MVTFLPETLGRRLLLKPKIEKESKGGIILARDARSQAINTNQGTVYMIGNGCWDDHTNPPAVNIGDSVYYAHFGAMTIKPDGEEDFLVIVNDEDILVAYKEEPKDGTGDSNSASG